MKKCPCCKLDKHPNEFNPSKKSKDGLQSYCKACNKQKSSSHYQENKPDYIQRNKDQAKENRQYIQDLKSQTPCMDCKKSYPSYVMDFDHRENKNFSIGTKGHKVALSTLKKEIEKCDIVCANCHRIRTYGAFF